MKWNINESIIAHYLVCAIEFTLKTIAIMLGLIANFISDLLYLISKPFSMRFGLWIRGKQ